jgi:hypothetical protein
LQIIGWLIEEVNFLFLRLNIGIWLDVHRGKHILHGVEIVNIAIGVGGLVLAYVGNRWLIIISEQTFLVGFGHWLYDGHVAVLALAEGIVVGCDIEELFFVWGGCSESGHWG